jgi:hypothetical protein
MQSTGRSLSVPRRVYQTTISIVIKVFFPYSLNAKGMMDKCSLHKLCIVREKTFTLQLKGRFCSCFSSVMVFASIYFNNVQCCARYYLEDTILSFIFKILLKSILSFQDTFSRYFTKILFNFNNQQQSADSSGVSCLLSC